MFKDLYHEELYTDITLVSDDQIQFEAHKIVLSDCSPVFKRIRPTNRAIFKPIFGLNI